MLRKKNKVSKEAFDHIEKFYSVQTLEKESLIDDFNMRNILYLLISTICSVTKNDM